MAITINEYIDDNLKQGHMKIYPFSEEIEELGFYILIHPSARIADTTGSYQCTLFLKEKPYCHSFRPLWDIKADIACKDYLIEDGILHSIMCDESVMELAECSEIPNNKKVEDIHILADKYNDKLSEIQEEKTHNLIKALFNEYIDTDKYSLQQVEEILNSLLR
jgi:hypothetical protein